MKYLLFIFICLFSLSPIFAMDKPEDTPEITDSQNIYNQQEMEQLVNTLVKYINTDIENNAAFDPQYFKTLLEIHGAIAYPIFIGNFIKLYLLVFYIAQYYPDLFIQPMNVALSMDEFKYLFIESDALWFMPFFSSGLAFLFCVHRIPEAFAKARIPFPQYDLFGAVARRISNIVKPIYLCVQRFYNNTDLDNILIDLPKIESWLKQNTDDKLLWPMLKSNNKELQQWYLNTMHEAKYNRPVEDIEADLNNICKEIFSNDGCCICYRNIGKKISSNDIDLILLPNCQCELIACESCPKSIFEKCRRCDKKISYIKFSLKEIKQLFRDTLKKNN